MAGRKYKSKSKHTNFKLHNNFYNDMPSQEDSPFLALPGEIRMLIYRACLIKPCGIDLWPPTMLADPEAMPELTARIEKAKGLCPSMHQHRVVRFRHQRDLEHVRQEIAVGLLRTCRQVFAEAAPIFWGGNTWRFSNDRSWVGVRRFLVTAGPRARAMMRRVEALAPIDAFRLKDVLMPDTERFAAYGYPAKNHPKLRMVKGAGNLDFVVDMLTRDCPDAPRELCFLVPEGWTLSEYRLNSLQDSLAMRMQGQLSVSEELVHFPEFMNLGWLKKVLIVEKGGHLEGPKYVAILNAEGIDVVVEKGASMSMQRDPSNIEGLIEVDSTRKYEASPARYDYLAGVHNLFEVDVALPANGGKATKRQRQRSTARVLQGFGGCRFVHYYGYYCLDCGAGNSDPKTTYGYPMLPRVKKCPVRWAQLTPAQQAQSENSEPRQWPWLGTCQWVFVDCVGIANGARAARQGVIRDAISGRLWST